MLRKIFLSTVLLLSLSNAQEDDKKQKEIIAYKNIFLNESLSLYAAKLNMGILDDTSLYSIGILLHEDIKSDIKYGIGYTANIEYENNYFKSNLPKQTKDTEGMLFFMNYQF